MTRFSINYLILFIILAPVFVIDIFFTYVHIHRSTHQAEELLQSKGEIITKQIAGASEFSLFSGDDEQIQYLLQQSINTNDIIFANVFNAQGGLIAEAKSEEYNSSNSEHYFYYSYPVKRGSIDITDIFNRDENTVNPATQYLGWVHLYISKLKLQEIKKQIFIEGIIFFCTILFLALLLTLLISRRITRPVFTLLDHLKLIESGQLGGTISDLENNEIGDVQRGFNSMSQSLKANSLQLNEKISIATRDLTNAISDLEFKNRELAIARDDAQDANRIKSQFLANMSHEIRTPINGINGFIGLLSKSGLQKEQKRYTEIIEQSTNDLSAIINEILDFTKIESGKIDISNQIFNLYDLVEETRDSLFTGALEKNIGIHLTIYSDTPSMLIGDSFRLKQILINLIGNAIKFTDHGYVNVTVLLEDASEDENRVSIRFNIEDTGIGISEHDQESLFHAFTQVDSDTNRRFSGTGLGLVISKDLARLMGGDIYLQSKLRSGSIFSLVLPFQVHRETQSVDNFFNNQTAMIIAFNQRCQNEVQSLFNRIGFNTEPQLIDKNSNPDLVKSQLLQNLKYINLVAFDLRFSSFHPDRILNQTILDNTRVVIMHYDQSLIDLPKYANYEFISVINTSNYLYRLLSDQIYNAESMPNENVPNPDQPSKDILIVDDNPINLTLACELVQIWGHRAHKASNAKKAMELFTEMDFDLILLDIQMPEIDGVELMQIMRQQQPELQTPIAAITANILEMEKSRLLNLGFDAYISKPINEKLLKDLLDQKEVINENRSDEPSATNPNAVIDYTQTLQLAGKSETIAQDVLSLLKIELPEYQNSLQKALELPQTEKISDIIHKLEGVTCYTGLPRLKQLLLHYQTIKHSSPEKIQNVCSVILEELAVIEEKLDGFLADKETAIPATTESTVNPHFSQE